MLKKINYKLTALYVAFFVLVSTSPVLAGIAEVDASTMSDKIVGVANEVVRPIGALLIFIALGITAFKLITTANKPNERAEAMGSIPYILGGGLLLGGLMLFAGFILGLMTKLAG
jgi:hypothetical protein